MNELLGRQKTANEIKQLLTDFDIKCKDVSFKKGIYIYGSPGCGKTEFVNEVLKELNYDIIRFDAGDVRNKSLIETITSDNISNRNVLHMMTKTVKKIVIVMDEIDGMNNGDKGGITALIKLIRQKKTRKQRLEQMTMNPIICIGNYYIDKKIRELMKVCNIFELKVPTQPQIQRLVSEKIPEFREYSADLRAKMLQYIQGDLRKWNFLYKIYQKNPGLITNRTLDTIFHTKSYNEDSKVITQDLINHPVKMEEHNVFMNETDRTIVALLWHENIVDAIAAAPAEKSYPFYLRVLKNICYADYIDRITFQNQIWQFNEMSSLMKTFYNNKLYHDHFGKPKYQAEEIRFTKVLTKYSTEYNNMLFVYNLCQELDMDKKDMLAMFQELRMIYGADFYEKAEKMAEVEKLFEDYNISKLDIKRIYRYLDKNVKKETLIQSLDELEDDLE
jgi:DNA polymerase III delta prime subunit